ncbi:MAG: CHASE2 domain-containing serine/threonine-protein kinase [Acidiferrobacterales bacterium]
MKTGFWQKDWFIGLAVTLFVFLTAGTDTLQGLERKAYDLGVRYSLTRPPNEHVVVIAIDDVSLEQLGRWPWPRHILAEVNRQLLAARPAAIGYTLSFDVSQNERGLAVLRELRKVHGNALGKKANALLKRAVIRLDTDRGLAASFRKGRVVLAVPYHASDKRPSDVAALPKTLHKYTLSNINRQDDKGSAYLPALMQPAAPLYADRVDAPISVIAQAVAGIGLGMPYPPVDGVVSAAPLVLSYGDQYLPSFPLAMAAASLGLKRTDIQVQPGHGVKLGRRMINTDSRLRAYPFFYKPRDDKPPFQVFAFHEVKKKKVPTKVFRSKVVLIGLTASEFVERLATPIGEPMPPVMVMAHTTSSLLNGDLYRAPSLSYWGRVGAFVVVALYLMFILPGLRVGTGLALSGLLLIVMLNVQFVLMILEALRIPLMAPAVALMCGHLLLAGKGLVQDRLEGFQAELSESSRMLGLSFQSQGQLDIAFDKFRKCHVDNSLLELLYNLALDFERKRQFNKARNVYQHIATHKRRFRDVQERLARSKAIEENTVLGGGVGTSTTGSLILDAEGLQKPMLGRYQIQKELAKGGMGVVYLGRDPKLSRVVAIKTLALSQEFEGERLAEVKERFFREARTAGRLNHPNIVTVYDVGDEQDLAYIAMDYMQGEDLSIYCKPENLLPVAEVLDIMIQVAEALEYAHGQRVIHRDIKPANIIYDRENSNAKVTDFGVACLVDARTTKTGIVLGTPCYMSPEQLTNKKLDGRSDLFSLGVTFYELLTGELPFDDDSLSGLMYKIANKKHRDVRKARADLPACAGQIVNRALHKDVKKRIQSGMQMADALRECRRKIEVL